MNREELQKKLNDLLANKFVLEAELEKTISPELVKDAIRTQIDKSALEIADLQKQLEPVDEEARGNHLRSIIKDKGLNLEYVGNGLLYKKKDFTFGQMNAVAASESTDKAAPTKRKRSLEDYRPNEEEINLANKMSNVDMRPNEIYVFEPECANTEVDIDNEEFDIEALNEMGVGCPATPTLLDHERSLMATIGKNMGGRVANKKLYIKFYVPDIEANKTLIANLAYGVYNAVSVSCGIPVMDYQCSSCKRPMVSDTCPHKPGMIDEKGALVRGVIKHIQRFFELSLVWLGAQNNANLRRNPMPSGNKSADVPESSEAGGNKKTFAEVINDLQAIQQSGDIRYALNAETEEFEVTSNEPIAGELGGEVDILGLKGVIHQSGKEVTEVGTTYRIAGKLHPPTTDPNTDPSTFDRIPVDEKSMPSEASEGENPVTEKKEQAQQAVEKAADEAAEVTAEQAVETEVVAEEVAAEEKAEEVVADEAAVADAKPADEVATEVATEAGGNEEALKTLTQSVLSMQEMLQGLMGVVAENKQAIEELKTTKSAEPELSVEDIARSVLDIAGEIESSKELSDSKPMTYAERIRKSLNSSQQSI